METKYAYECIAPQMQSLRYCGYYQLDPQSPKIYKFLHRIYTHFCLIWITVFSIQEVIKMFTVRDDKEKIISVLSLFLTHTDSIYKQAIFWLKEDKIEGLLDTMRGPLYNQGQAEHRAFFQRFTREGYLFLRSFNMMVLVTCFLWALLAVVQHLQNKTVEFAFWIPFDYNENPQFYFTTFYLWTTISWQGFGNSCMDMFISFLLAQSQIQLRILRTELTNLVQRSKLEAQHSNTSHKQILKERFKMLIDHHRKILDFAENVQNIFNGVIFYQFLVGGWIICTSVYKMVDMEPGSVEFISMTAYMYCILVEIFLYCYFGSELTSESELLSEAVFNMDWLEMAPIYRKDVLILMERVKRPIQPIAGNIIPLSKDSFIRILKSSYSFFALLRATTE